MLKIATLCGFCGILFVFIGSFEKSFIGIFESLMRTQAKPCFFVQSSTLNVRSAPSLEAKITNKLQQNFQICEYSNAYNGFLQINQGWVATQYLSLVPFRQKQDSIPVLAKFPQDSKMHLLAALESPNTHRPKFKLISTPKPINSDATDKQMQDSTQNLALEQIVQARAEMDSKNYTRAKNLALQVNSNNPKNLESWEIFVKSLYLEGNAQEAILVLQNFLRQSYDKNLAILLHKMQQGHKI